MKVEKTKVKYNLTGCSRKFSIVPLIVIKASFLTRLQSCCIEKSRRIREFLRCFPISTTLTCLQYQFLFSKMSTSINLPTSTYAACAEMWLVLLLAQNLNKLLFSMRVPENEPPSFIIRVGHFKSALRDAMNGCWRNHSSILNNIPYWRHECRWM